jgi:2-phosphosulfolactate phosphatase
MKFTRANISTYQSATDLVVAIDVLRAFTTAAYLFYSGVMEIILVSGVQEAFDLRNQMPECLLAGEVKGIMIPGFDLGNSSANIDIEKVTGRRIIQRTSAGTQGVVLAVNATTILAAALTNVTATLRYIQWANPESITLIQTGLFPEDGWGDEDVACADSIESLWLGQSVDWQKIDKRVRNSRAGTLFDGSHADFPVEDLELALRVDQFNFAMVVERRNGLNVLLRVDI